MKPGGHCCSSHSVDAALRRYATRSEQIAGRTSTAMVRRSRDCTLPRAQFFGGLTHSPAIRK
ncbi:hypothetical protein SS05631_d64710 (plasmid) [Sinorhizobium sp. CCBAU 05631]|nr:hypothetical protein SS05631_d64710 [Sinorhizobium sp. CCBAU 05631]